MVAALLPACSSEHGSDEPNVRIGDGRFSVPTAYQSLAAVGFTTTPALLRNAAVWRRAALADPTPANLRRLGVAHASVANLDDAIRILEELSATGDGGAEAWSDLSAAYLARAHRADDVSDLFRALNSAGAAVHANASFAPGWFNEAVAQAALGLRAQSSNSWQNFLELETNVEWRNEALSRVDQLGVAAPADWTLTSRIEPSSAFAAQRWLLEVGIPEFFTAGSPPLTVLADISNQLSSITGDPMWSDVAKEVGQPAAGKRPYLLYAEAHRAARIDDFVRRRTLLLDACREFRLLGSSLTALCTAEQATIEALSLDYLSAEGSAQAAGRIADSRGYRFALARAISAEAMVHTSVGRFARAAQLFPVAIAGLLAAHSIPEAISVETTYADLLNLLGR